MAAEPVLPEVEPKAVLAEEVRALTLPPALALRAQELRILEAEAEEAAVAETEWLLGLAAAA